MTHHRYAGLTALAAVLATHPLAAQHKAVCGAGVKDYAAISEVPVPFDTLRMPPGPPIRVTSPEEEQEANRQVHERAGSIGATGLVIVDQTDDDGSGGMRMRRSIVPVFVAADTTRAYAACRAQQRPN